MTQEALDLLMRTSPRHARHIETMLENRLDGKATRDLIMAAGALQGYLCCLERDSDEAIECDRLSDRLLSYSSKLSLGPEPDYTK